MKFLTGCLSFVLLVSCSESSEKMIEIQKEDLQKVQAVVSGDLLVSSAPDEKKQISRRVLRKSPFPVIWPYEDLKITSHYGFRIHPVLKTVLYHRGLDMAKDLGTEVYAVARGKVITCKYHLLFGNLVEIEHPGNLISQYAHLSEILVFPGDYVKAGSLIGLTGSTGRSTGSHLHLGFIAGGHSIDPYYVLGRTWTPLELKAENIPWVYTWLHQ
ncbi:MAG: M23 family metallopeptidase [Deltaproteobacteria bacterium]|nr:M23 family metallopeptidase [Deltaproteobacteria bacterium]